MSRIGPRIGMPHARVIAALLATLLASASAFSVSRGEEAGPSATMMHRVSSLRRAPLYASTARRMAGAKQVGPASFVEAMPST